MKEKLLSNKGNYREKGAKISKSRKLTRAHKETELVGTTGTNLLKQTVRQVKKIQSPNESRDFRGFFLAFFSDTGESAP